MTEKLWYNDLKGFITQDNFLKFFPTPNMTYHEKINSIVRFTLYLVIILVLFKNNYKTLYILVIVLLLTYGMSLVDTVEKKQEQETFQRKNLAVSKTTKKECVKPTVDNPFMNVLLTDYKEGAPRGDKEACDFDNKNVKKSIKEKYDERLFRSTDDVFMNNSGDRQFYTMPVTDVVNDQTGFAKWLYDRGPTCKQGAVEKCYDNVSEVILGRVE
tara:strand:- start:3858 stop:4499 length:642 start_codon:yes stop_codon:yes gene_type:complete